MTVARVAAIAAFLLVPALGVGAAQAKGCLKGALAGGVVGHYAGHHGVLGAIGGCVAGRHFANERDRQRAEQQRPAPNPGQSAD